MNLYWNKPLKLKSGNYVIFAYIQEEDKNIFWKIWDTKKNEIKEKGFSVKKYNQKWQINYWFKDNDISKNYYKCNELCKELGFIENDINNRSLNFDLLNLPNEIIKKIIEYIYYFKEKSYKNGIKIACKKTYRIYKEIHNNDIYNKTNDYIKEIFEFLQMIEKELYIDFLREEIIIHFSDSDKPRIMFISYNNNRKILYLKYRPDWDKQRVFISSSEYDIDGKLIVNKKQETECFSCLFFKDYLYEKIENIAMFLKKNYIYNNSIALYDLDESLNIIYKTNTIKKVEYINKYKKDKNIYDKSFVIKLCLNNFLK